MSEGVTPIPTVVLGHPKQQPLEMLIKRAFDILVSLVGLVLLAPLFAWVAWRIRRDSPGPVFFRGPRVGRNGKVFQILKFRTMYENPESYDGPPLTAEDDPRLTPYGRYLRDTKLNELPQLWNVLKGEMSLVGPRPEDPQVASQWPAGVRQEVLSMRPGITSPSSVRYRDEGALLKSGDVIESYLSDILPSKLRMDQLYVRHHSFWSDLDVLFWTSLVLLPQAGAYQPTDRRLYSGPINRLMRNYVSWFMIDLTVALIAVALTVLFWRSFGPLHVGIEVALIFTIGYALLFSLTGALTGVQRISWSRASASDALDLVPGVLLATAITMAINYFGPGNKTLGTRTLLPQALILIASALTFIGIALARYRGRLVTGLATRWITLRGAGGGAQERVLIVGGGQAGQFAAWMLGDEPYTRLFRVVGFIDDDLFKQGTRIRGVNVLGGRDKIAHLAKQHDVGIILYAIHNISAQERQRILEICLDTPARVVLFPDIPGALNGISRANGNGKGAVEGSNGGAPPSTVATLPCDLCLMKVSPLKVDRWLAQLESTAHAGDLDALQAQIQELRSQVRGDVAVQRRANDIPDTSDQQVGEKA